MYSFFWSSVYVYIKAIDNFLLRFYSKFKEMPLLLMYDKVKFPHEIVKHYMLIKIDLLNEFCFKSHILTSERSCRLSSC